MIRVNVHFAGLSRSKVQSPVSLVVSSEATVRDLLDALEQRHPELRMLWGAQGDHRRIAIGNKQIADPLQRLAREDGDTLEVTVLIVPPIAGGSSSSGTTWKGAR